MEGVNIGDLTQTAQDLAANAAQVQLHGDDDWVGRATTVPNYCARHRKTRTSF